MVNLLKCRTKEEAAKEVIMHFAREHHIREKYEKHDKRIQEYGIEL